MQELLNPSRIRSDLHHLYEELYDGQSEWRDLGAIDKAANIVRLGTAVPHETVLDIGAGEGAVLARLSALGFAKEYYAVEIAKSALSALQGRAIPGLVEAKWFDGYAVPYERTFDVAVLSHVLEHVEHPRLLLAEAARLARHLVVEVPLEDTLRAPEDFSIGKSGHINFYSHRTIRKLLQSSGFEVLEQINTPVSYRVYEYQYGWRAIYKALPKILYLKLFTNWALNRFTYHSTLLCRPLSAPSNALSGATARG